MRAGRPGVRQAPTPFRVSPFFFSIHTTTYKVILMKLTLAGTHQYPVAPETEPTPTTGPRPAPTGSENPLVNIDRGVISTPWTIRHARTIASIDPALARLSACGARKQDHCGNGSQNGQNSRTHWSSSLRLTACYLSNVVSQRRSREQCRRRSQGTAFRRDRTGACSRA